MQGKIIKTEEQNAKSVNILINIRAGILFLKLENIEIISPTIKKLFLHFEKIDLEIRFT